MAANAVVLVLRGYQIAIATYLRGATTLTHIIFERDPLNIFQVRALKSSGSTGGGGRGDAKTIISPNISFGDIINGRWFIGNFNMKLNGRWFPQIVDHVDMDSGNLYIQYIIPKFVVLASEPVGGRSRATELPCLVFLHPNSWGDIFSLCMHPHPMVPTI